MAIRRPSKPNKDDFMSNAMDKRLEELEEEISAIYTLASEDATENLDNYLTVFEKAKEKMYARYIEGEISEQEYREWLENMIVRREEYQAMISSITDILTNADIAAMALVEGELPYVIAQSYDFGQFVGSLMADREGMDNVSFRIYNADSVQAIIRDNPDLIPMVDVPVDQAWNRTHLRRELTASIINGDSIPDVARRLRRITSMDQNAAIRNARTAMTAGENLGRNESYNRIRSQGIEMVKEWSATYDSRTRDTHRLLNGTRANEKGLFGEGILDSLGEPLMEFPGDPKGAAAEIYNCFVGDTVISADSNIIRTYKHEYKGKLLTIKTSGGIEFTCTPNHPILTLNGWIAAESLNEGDDLIVTSRSNNVISGRNPNVNHAFTRFDALHEFFNKIGSKRIRTLGVNFHGDIPTSDVEIVTQKGFLRNNRNTGRNKLIDKFLFIFSNKSFLSDSSFVKHLRCVRLATLSLICRRSKSFAFFLSGLRHSKVHSLRPIALLDSGFIKSINDSPSADVKILCETLNGFSGVVFSDKIISVDINEGSAHVYNLQSENGYYFVNSNINQINKNSNGIFAVAHNCRCRLNIVPPNYSREANAQAYERWMQENYPADYRALNEDNYFDRIHKTDEWTAEAQQRVDRRIERLRQERDSQNSSLSPLEIALKNANNPIIEGNIPKGHEEEAAEVINGVNDVLRDFGITEDGINRIYFADKYRGTAGMNGFGDLTISNSYLSKPITNSHGYAVSDTYYGTGAHEAGHRVAHLLLTRLMDGASHLEIATARSNNKIETYIIREARRRFGSNPPISGYGSTNVGEKIAEAVSDVYANGTNANPYSVVIVDVMRDINNGIFIPKIRRRR